MAKGRSGKIVIPPFRHFYGIRATVPVVAFKTTFASRLRARWERDEYSHRRRTPIAALDRRWRRAKRGNNEPHI
jgi:hypothetical protein